MPTSAFPYASFPFEHFNPVQSRFAEFFGEAANSLIAAATSAGKTCVAEMALSHEIRANGGKGMYLSPLRALTQEKIDDWSEKSHHFSDLKLSICTGDYRLTPERQQELAESQLILMTNEMLASRTRNFESENNTFLRDLRVLVVDESHLIGTDRGPSLEAALMKFTALNPECRLVLLSATMPNVSQLAEWVTKLTDRKTYVLRSDYRPCPLARHFIPYEDKGWKYDQKEAEKVLTALEIVQYYDQDKFLIFAHTKRTGELMCRQLKAVDIECYFHNADLDKSKRIKVERRFREDPSLRVIVATSTLSAGLNMPARRVIVLGCHCGLNPVPPSMIAQMCGRAGRPRFDPRGDAYILVPKSEEDKFREYVRKVEAIQSQMVNTENRSFKTLAFHLVSEINQGTVKTKTDIFNWYERSLAALQLKDLDDDLVERMIAALKARGIVYEEDGEYKTTIVGRLSSCFYYQPFDVADWKQNFSVLFDENKEQDDHWIAMALSNVDTVRLGIVNSQEREQIGDFFHDVLKPDLKRALGQKGGFADSTVKHAFCYFSAMNGAINPVLAATTRGLQQDFSRLTELLQALDSSMKWGRKDYLKKLAKRITYGVEWKLLDLCELPGVGAVKARKLYNATLTSLDKVATKPHIVRLALDCSLEKAEEIVSSAKKIIKGL